MEIELGNVQAQTSESLKSHQRSDRKNKELTFQIEEDEKKQQTMEGFGGEQGKSQAG